jgi:hypothetical protein
MILDGRDGAFGQTVKKTQTGDLPSSLILACKNAVFITDSSMDDRVNDTIYQAIDLFEQHSSIMVLPSNVSVDYEYFKGRNRLPYLPVNSVTPITGYVISGAYIEGGNGSATTVDYTSGFTELPKKLETIISRIFEQLWHNESGTGTISMGLLSQVRSYA